MISDEQERLFMAIWANQFRKQKAIGQEKEWLHEEVRKYFASQLKQEGWTLDFINWSTQLMNEGAK